MEAVAFFAGAIGALGGAIAIIALRNPFYSVLALIVHLVSLAGGAKTTPTVRRWHRSRDGAPRESSCTTRRAPPTDGRLLVRRPLGASVRHRGRRRAAAAQPAGDPALP